jgi:hypothetical protein
METHSQFPAMEMNKKPKLWRFSAVGRRSGKIARLTRIVMWLVVIHQVEKSTTFARLKKAARRFLEPTNRRVTTAVMDGTPRKNA